MDIWTDKSKFTHFGFTIEITNEVRFSPNVWARLRRDKLVGPFIFENNLNSYTHLLEKMLPYFYNHICITKFKLKVCNTYACVPHQITQKNKRSRVFRRYVRL